MSSLDRRMGHLATDEHCHHWNQREDSNEWNRLCGVPLSLPAPISCHSSPLPEHSLGRGEKRQRTGNNLIHVIGPVTKQRLSGTEGTTARLSECHHQAPHQVQLATECQNLIIRAWKNLFHHQPVQCDCSCQY